MSTPTEQSAASQIVLLCASAQLSQRGEERLLQLVRSGPDWSVVKKWTDRHSLHPLLFKHLRSLEQNGVPTDFLQSLRHLANVRAKQNFLLTAELLRVKGIMFAQGIEFFAYKGPCLAQQGYGDATLRAYGDLDVVIEAADLPAVRKILRARGYVEEPPREPPLSETFMNSPLFLRLDHEQSFARYEGSRQAPSYVIDVHWQVMEEVPAQATMPLLLLHRQELTLLGGKIDTIKPDLLLLILCVHGTKHQWEHLKWIVDIAELIKTSSNLNWVEIYRLADLYSVSKMINLALLLCKALPEFQCSLPEFVNDRLQRSDLNDLVKRTLDAWFAEEAHRYNLRNYWLYQLRTFDNLRSRVDFLMEEVCQPNLPTYLRCPLPTYMFWLYTAIRPMFLITDFVSDKQGAKEG